jgi:hypothetical protein
MNEAIVTINGVQLTVGQSMALRVAVGSFAQSMQDNGLGDDAHGKAMAEAYIARIAEIESLIVNPLRGPSKQCAASGQADCYRSTVPGSEYCAEHSNRKINRTTS